MNESGEWSAPERFDGNEVELVDEIVMSEDILDEDGSVIGEHIETIDLLNVDGQGVVMIDDVTIVTDDGLPQGCPSAPLAFSMAMSSPEEEYYRIVADAQVNPKACYLKKVHGRHNPDRGTRGS